MIAGALWREARQFDRLAWQTAYLMNAFGSKPDGASVWEPRLLLGRDMVPSDPRDAASDSHSEPISEKAARAHAMIADAALRRAARASGGR